MMRFSRGVRPATVWRNCRPLIQLSSPSGEPFVGGGAVLFDILSKYDLDEVYISDINAELANTYLIIRDNIDKLIAMLTVMQNEFVPTDTELRKAYYLTKRERFNDLKVNGDETINIEKAALMIFLNKTCFNGLFRVNKKDLAASPNTGTVRAIRPCRKHSPPART